MKALGRQPLSEGERATLVGWSGFAAAALFAVVFYLLRYVALPFAIAAAFAYLAAPLVRVMQRRGRLPHWIAALIVYIAYLALVFGLLLLAKATVVPQLTGLARAAPENLHRLLVGAFHGETAVVFGQSLNATQLARGIMGWIAGGLRNPGQFTGLATVSIGVLTGFFLTLALLGYFLFEGPRLRRSALWLVPPRFRERIGTIASDVSPIVYGYVRGLLIIVIYATFVTWIVMRFVVNVPGAEVVSLAIGMLEVVPFFGPILSMLLIGLVAAEHATPATIVAFAAFVTGLRVSIDQFVGPLVLGSAVKLPAPVVIFAFLAGATLYGPVGVLLAVPVAAAVKIVLRDMYGDTSATMTTRRKNRDVVAR